MDDEVIEGHLLAQELLHAIDAQEIEFELEGNDEHVPLQIPSLEELN